MNSPIVIFEDDDLLIRRLSGSSQQLVLAFTGLQHKTEGENVDEFIGVASNAGHNHVLFISDLTCSWYSRNGLVAKIADVVNGYIADNNISETITIGNSMGGYGAILFAAHLPVSKVIAFVPQISMHLSVLLDTRWMRHRENFGAAIPLSLCPIIENSGAQFFLFFGADNKADAEHARLLPSQNNLTTFTVEKTGHGISSRLKELGLLAPIVADILNNSGIGLGKILVKHIEDSAVKARTGHCLCGAVGFTIKPLNPEVGTCHCKMCQRWAGSALLAMETPAETITFTGESHIKRYQSSDWAERAWCDACGSSLWYQVTTPSETPHPYEIPIGLLDNTAGLSMTREIYVDEKAELVDFKGERETLTAAECLALYAGNEE